MREEGLDLNRVWNSQFQIYMWRSHNLLTDQIISKVNWSCVSLINEKWKEKKNRLMLKSQYFPSTILDQFLNFKNQFVFTFPLACVHSVRSALHC